MSRAYNNALAMASVGCKEVRQGGFNPTFTVQGKLHHTIGTLLPADGEDPKFAQLFFVDSDHRIQQHANLNPRILKEIQSELKDINPYLKSFKTAIDINKDQPDLNFVLHADKKTASNAHKRTLNLPSASEIAALIPGERCLHRDTDKIR